jgi:hypothetical protein
MYYYYYYYLKYIVYKALKPKGMYNGCFLYSSTICAQIFFSPITIANYAQKRM